MVIRLEGEARVVLGSGTWAEIEPGCGACAKNVNEERYVNVEI